MNNSIERQAAIALLHQLGFDCSEPERADNLIELIAAACDIIDPEDAQDAEDARLLAYHFREMLKHPQRCDCARCRPELWVTT